MSEPMSLDVTNLPRFLDHLAERQPEAAEFASRLIDEGGIIVDFWGPESMDVWDLRVRRGDWITVFHVERGFAEWARVGRLTVPSLHSDAFMPLGLAILAWARANRKPFRFDDADDLDHDLMTSGTETLDWLNHGNGDAFDRVVAAWTAYRRTLVDGRDEAARHALPAQAVAAIEAAARG